MGRLADLQPGRPDRAVHGYFYYRWTTAYMRVVRWALERPWLGPVRTWAARALERTHHAKVVPSAEARHVLTLDAPLDLRGLERVVPYPVARDVVLEAPTRIALAECACRAVAAGRGEHDGSCGPVDSCLYVGDPIASFVVEKQPGRARFVTADEALAVIDGAAARGNVHTLWFKDAAAGRMYAVCNCCSCCCIGMKARGAGFDPLAGSGYVAVVDAARCNGCGACERTCAFDAVTVAARDAVAVVDAGACMGCGACERVCPESAITLVRATDGPEPVPWGAGGRGTMVRTPTGGTGT